MDTAGKLQGEKPDVTGLSVVVSPSPTANVLSGETLSITCQWSADYTGQLASVNYRLNDDDGSLGTLFMNFGTTCPDTPPNGPSYTFSCNRDTRTMEIQIPANSYSHGDRWTCEGRNNTSDSTTQTDTTTVDVVVPVASVIISPPTTVTVDVGTNTTLTCVTQPHSRPTANVTWYRMVSGQPQMITSNISVSYDAQHSALSTTSVLSYVPSKEDNGRAVYCVTDGGWTGSTSTTIKSNEVSLNVRYPPTHPLTVTGNTDPVYDDDDIDLRCSIRGGNPIATLSWMCPGQSVMSSPSDTSDTAISVLRITLTPFYNGANCTCTATHHVQGFTSTHTEVFNVYFAPQIRALTVTDPFPWLAREDYVGRLSCDTTNGNPSPTRYTWHRDGLVVNSLTSQVIMFGPPVSSDDGRVYKCRADNAFTDIKGSAPESQITLDVQFAPVLTSDCQVKVNETDNYQCTCTAVGKPTPVVTWLPQNLSSNNVLNFLSINRDKAGLYTCKVTSSSSKFGTLQTQSVLNLVVQYAPDVTLLAQNSTEDVRSLVMTCNASGVPNSYTFGNWVHKYDNTLIRTLTGDEKTQGRTLTLDTVSYQDIGTYTCQVQNSITGRNGQLTQTGTAVFDVRVTVAFGFPAAMPRLHKTICDLIFDLATQQINIHSIELAKLDLHPLPFRD
ncbi:hemicentin-1-like [Ylistrum balloti]|uniref:hemicentin-1-like n=1 Tax=Ylistrum balloti TaxID=509963 RepID=UPI0029059931|nr:hemicentin-1-like [Ylistrum balloti]